MKRKQLSFKRGFHVAIDEKHAQAAEMTIAPGGKEGGSDNRHRGADQWLFVVAGSGVAKVTDAAGQRRRVELQPGTLLVVEHGERHEIDNTGDDLLKTLNFYYPPAFDAKGDPVGPGKD